nr:MAG TPA: hypothetical protein [Caudoviricetes sp.]
MNKCKILRDLMVTLDRITANGVVKGQCQHVASKLGEYCAGVESFVAPTVNDFFEDDVTSRRVTGVVVCGLDKNVEMPEELNCPVGIGTLLFALHEYQHRYHDDDDPTLVDGKSTLELREWELIESLLKKAEWTFVQIALKKTYFDAVAGRAKEMAFGLFELRKALQDWLPAEYVKIFIDDHD